MWRARSFFLVKRQTTRGEHVWWNGRICPIGHRMNFTSFVLIVSGLMSIFTSVSAGEHSFAFVAYKVILIGCSIPGPEGEVQVSENRPKFVFNILDALIVDTVEFILDSSCNRTQSDAFDSVFWCFGQVLEQPNIRLAWTYRNYHPRVIGLKNFFCA